MAIDAILRDAGQHVPQGPLTADLALTLRLRAILSFDIFEQIKIREKDCALCNLETLPLSTEGSNSSNAVLSSALLRQRPVQEIT